MTYGYYNNDIYFNFTNHMYFQSLEVVRRGSKAQHQVTENLNWIAQRSRNQWAICAYINPHQHNSSGLTLEFLPVQFSYGYGGTRGQCWHLFSTAMATVVPEASADICSVQLWLWWYQRPVLTSAQYSYGYGGTRAETCSVHVWLQWYQTWYLLSSALVTVVPELIPAQFSFGYGGTRADIRWVQLWLRWYQTWYLLSSGLATLVPELIPAQFSYGYGGT